MDRQNDRNEGGVINLLSHSDIYRLEHLYPFVKCYGGIGIMDDFVLRFDVHKISILDTFPEYGAVPLRATFVLSLHRFIGISHLWI